MKTLIGIISYNRPYEIKKKIGYWINEIKNADVKVFVCPDQMMYYEQSIDPKFLVEGSQQGGKDGYINQLIFMQNWAKENGYDYILKCDDDMVFKANGFKKDKHAENIDKSILEIEDRFSQNKDISAIAYCLPMEWLHSDKYGFKKRLKHFSGNYFIRVDRYFMHSDLYIHDDMMVWLDLKVRGLGYCETYFGLYQEAILGKNEGGLQSFDRLSISKETYENALKYYPELKLKEVDPDKIRFDIGKAIDNTFYKKL